MKSKINWKNKDEVREYYRNYQKKYYKKTFKPKKENKKIFGICKNCGEKFTPYHNTDSYCSSDCSRAKYLINLKPIICANKNCNKKFKPYHRRQLYCCIACKKSCEYFKGRVSKTFKEWKRKHPGYMNSYMKDYHKTPKYKKYNQTPKRKKNNVIKHYYKGHDKMMP